MILYRLCLPQGYLMCALTGLSVEWLIDLVKNTLFSWSLLTGIYVYLSLTNVIIFFYFLGVTHRFNVACWNSCWSETFSL